MMKQEKTVSSAMAVALGKVLAWLVFMIVMYAIYWVAVPTLIVILLALWGVIVPTELITQSLSILYILAFLMKILFTSKK